MRQAPDVILVGEMRDHETIGAAVTAAETGHLVMGTLHTNSAPEAIDRIIDVFPEAQQEQVRVQLANNLQAILTQQLIPKAEGRGRILAYELLIATPAIRNLIREAKVHQIPSASDGAELGMLTMDACLAELKRLITYEVGYERSVDAEVNLPALADTGGISSLFQAANGRPMPNSKQAPSLPKRHASSPPEAAGNATGRGGGRFGRGT
ncbi:MAG: ATPase, T2SS/T4P/T4SS family [Deinococcales bacterium]